MTTCSDEELMREAIREAQAAAQSGEIPVGAVIALRGDVIGRGRNGRKLRGSPFAHAEMEAIADAATQIGAWRFDDCCMYVTLEPCVMCAGAMVETRFSRLVYGARDARRGACGSLYDIPRDPRIGHKMSVRAGVFENECAALLTDFFRSKRTHLRGS